MLPKSLLPKPTVPKIVLSKPAAPRAVLPRELRTQLPEYKPPSFLAQHKGLAIAFGILFIALAAWCLSTPRGSRYAPPPKQPIYVDTVVQ
jgi:hypothetical protein